MGTPVTNFALVTIDPVGYSSGATSIALQSGDGSKLPDTTGGYTYPGTWWNATDFSHPADDPDVEIVLVTNRSADTLTIARAQEGTVASAKNIAGKTYRMMCGVTKRMWDDLQRPKSFVQGLQLQTHRDADLADHQVELVDVDSIIMDDGTELRNDSGEWTGKVADITVSGAAGLDSGVETVGTWYEIYAITKEDGTRNLLLHASKLWSVDTNKISGEDASQGIRSAVDNSTVKVAQGFLLSNSGVCPYIEAKLLKVGTPAGKIWFTIETDSAGKPSGSVLATSHAYDVSRLSTAAINIRFSMKTSTVLSAGATQYHLVAQGDWTVSATNYVAWRMDGSASNYTAGAKALFDSDTSTWTIDTDDDMIFSVAIESNVSLVTLPTGYTKQCFLGWVFNNADSDFVPFVQVDRRRRVASITIDERNLPFSGEAQLIDLLQWLPPRPMIKAIIGVSGTGSGSCLAAIGDLRAADISSSGTTVGSQALLYASTTADAPSVFGDVFVQSVGVMAMGTPGGMLWVVGFEW